MLIVPAVDVLEGRVVRLLRGEFSDVTRYGDDPVEAAVSWVEEGATLVHVVDLEGARSGRPDPELWDRLAAREVPFQVGGGVRTAEAARRALEAGAVRVVMGTAAVQDPAVLADVGAPDRVVAAVDVRRGKATTAGWLGTGAGLEEVLVGLVGAGVRHVLVTGIGRDGTMAGPDLGLVATVRRVAPGLGVTASGGVGALDDLVAVARAGCEAVIVGRALYEGRFTLAEARAAVA